MKKYYVTALGELLIDLIENGTNERGIPMYEANAGGAPCNLLSVLSSLGEKTAFIGKVGADHFGKQLINNAASCGIDTSGISVSEYVPTTLACVHTLPDGDRTFSFYRNPGADMTLGEDDLNKALLENCCIFHFGTLSMTSVCSASATRKAVSIAKEAGACVSFDPNLRMSLWDDTKKLRAAVEYGLSVCDVLKIADNELEWLFGSTDHLAAAKALKEAYHIPLIFVTLGKNGSFALSDHGYAYHKGYRVNTIDTTGAGDTFFGAALYCLDTEKPYGEYTDTELSEILTFANAAAAIITTRKGAMQAMPSIDEIQDLIRET